MDRKPLLGIHAKIERTEAQIKELNEAIRAFYAPRPYEVRPKSDPDQPIEIWRVHFSDCPPVLNVMVGEILHNLCSTLDQLACAIANTTSGSTEGTYFPFAKTASFFEDKLAEKTKNLPADARDMIRVLNPYKAGNNLLWNLHHLNI
jgi:hypothetical protein